MIVHPKPFSFTYGKNILPVYLKTELLEYLEQTPAVGIDLYTSNPMLVILDDSNWNQDMRNAGLHWSMEEIEASQTILGVRVKNVPLLAEDEGLFKFEEEDED